MANRKDARQALRDYRKRRGIECLFGDAKMRGLSMEDTRLIATEKFSTLLAIVTPAIA